MSGFEIAGLVLGALPLIITALQHGVTAVSVHRGYAREIRSIIRLLETEHVKLQNVCEKLLVGLVPPTQFEAMINDPFGPAWREPQLYAEIRFRLYRSCRVFEDTVADLREAVEEIRERLKIDKDGNVQWAEASTFKRQFKRLAFVFQRSNYQDLLARIRDDVSNLESLTRSNTDLEPDRKVQSHGRLSTIIRNISESIFEALRSSIKCACPWTHDVGLQVLSPATAIPDDRDDEILNKLHFRLLVSHKTMKEDEGVSFEERRQWHEVVLRPAITAPIPCPKTAPSVVSTKSLPVKKKARFSVTSPQSITTTFSTATTIGTQSIELESAMASLRLATAFSTPQSTSVHEIEAITDFCCHLRRARKAAADKCCGRILDPEVKRPGAYDVYLRDTLDIKLDWPFMTLKEILLGTIGQKEQLRFDERLRLAWLMALALLQLEGTRWISSPPTNDDIFILQGEESREIFVLHHFPLSAKKPAQIALSRTSTMLCLGALLIEVMLGQPLQDLVSASSNTAPCDPLTDPDTSRWLLDRITMTAGEGYAGAVRRCIKGSFREDSFGHRGGQSAFAEIVGILEEDLRHSKLS